MLFKILHWPFAGLLLTLALPFPYIVFLPVFLSVTSKIRNFNIYNTVFILLLLALNSVFSALLSLNVSKSAIEDSYNISRNYTKVNAILQQIPENRKESAVNLKIDETLKIVHEYQDKILQIEGLSRKQWESNPGGLGRPDAAGLAAYAILKPDGSVPGIELESGLKNLIHEFEKTPGYEELTKSAPMIFNFKDTGSDEDSWGMQVFTYQQLSWALIYLDGLEVNLKSIKASFNTTI
jgi:hypothetical protein